MQMGSMGKRSRPVFLEPGSVFSAVVQSQSVLRLP